ncbi:spermatogenesis-associated protein 2-like protein [Python bivittatus]|uniref:Spermatogenesis-associated protein 2-like protein n=1 Tax=Python bivittatus TaxID=176946 RepID=A0A9F5N457_PYTBI|nr:spermatogenesis-associated protein 2-like protein [Python bivittatus]
MNRGALLQDEYRRCLERDFHRGHVGACSDASLKDLLRHHLLEDSELHCSLDGEDTFATLAAALRGHLDLRGALRDLGRAFEVLELAAVNLYFFPWRKEFGTIKTFSGVYVHVLQGVLPEADLARSFRRLGYVQQDHLHLVNSRLPPGANLLSAACCFFAARVECEILAKIVEELEPRVVPPDELLMARKEAKGSLERCVAKLQSLARWPRSREVRPEPSDGLDLYRESPEGQSPYGEPSGGRLLSREPAPLSECGSPRLLRREQPPWSPQALVESRSEPSWTREPSCGNGLLASEGPDLATSFSFISLRRELSRTAEMDFPAQLGNPFLAPSIPHESPALQAHGAGGPASPSRQPRSLRHTQGLGMGAAAEPVHYQMHSCLLPGALPCSCCNTCRLLHGSSCDGAQICRNHHHVEELQSEKQQRLWLQRTEVDRLLHEAGGPWQ